MCLGVSVYQVAQESGVSQQAIANYEKQEHRPTLECLMKVSRALGFTPSEIVALAEKKVKIPNPAKLTPLKRGKKPKE